MSHYIRFYNIILPQFPHIKIPCCACIVHVHAMFLEYKSHFTHLHAGNSGLQLQKHITWVEGNLANFAVSSFA